MGLDVDALDGHLTCIRRARDVTPFFPQLWKLRGKRKKERKKEGEHTTKINGCSAKKKRFRRACHVITSTSPPSSCCFHPPKAQGTASFLLLKICYRGSAHTHTHTFKHQSERFFLLLLLLLLVFTVTARKMVRIPTGGLCCTVFSFHPSPFEKFTYVFYYVGR